MRYAGHAGDKAPDGDGTISEDATQYSGSRQDKVRELVVGLDFGTSCAKVIIRDPSSRRAVAVRWHVGTHGYLLPTVLHTTTGGVLGLTPTDPATGTPHTDLKVALMDQSNDVQAQARAAAYLGLALRAARQWFLDTQKGIYGQYTLRWVMNLGIPSAGYDDKECRTTFALVARAAWQLSLRPERPTLDAAARVLEQNASAVDSRVPVEVVPEIVAEVIGYARSRMRRNGLHVLVDVGASTIDICGFVLQAPDGDDCYDLLTALVENIGLQTLHLDRMAKIKCAGQAAKLPANLDPFVAPKERGRHYLTNPHRSLMDALDAVDEEYTQTCAGAITKVLMHLKKKHFPDPEAPQFKSGLPLFVGGGGAQFRLVHEAIQEAEKRLKKAIVQQGGVDRKTLLPLESLELEGIPDELAGRLAVACGLSFDKLEIGTITPPSDIKAAPPLPQWTPPQVPPPFVRKHKRRGTGEPR